MTVINATIFSILQRKHKNITHTKRETLNRKIKKKTKLIIIDYDNIKINGQKNKIQLGSVSSDLMFMKIFPDEIALHNKRVQLEY